MQIYLYSVVIDIKNTSVFAVYVYWSVILVFCKKVFHKHIFVSYLTFLNDLNYVVSLQVVYNHR